MSYYLFRDFLMLDQEYQALMKIPFKIKQQIHDIDMFDSDFVMTCDSKLTSVSDTLNKIYLSKTLLY